MLTIRPASRLAFVVGVLPLLGLVLFSPGLRSENLLGWTCFGFGLITLGLLVGAGYQRRADLVFIALQVLLLGLVLYQTFSDAGLYLGT